MIVSECCDAEVRYRYCAKCGQECRIRAASDTAEIAKRFRQFLFRVRDDGHGWPNRDEVVAMFDIEFAGELANVGTPDADTKEAARIATWMANTFYPEQEFALLNDLSGILSQIDNMMVGVYERSVVRPDADDKEK